MNLKRNLVKNILKNRPTVDCFFRKDNLAIHRDLESSNRREKYVLALYRIEKLILRGFYRYEILWDFVSFNNYIGKFCLYRFGH
jgi:hypothetical protein